MVIGHINPATNGEQVPITISNDSLTNFKKLPYIKHIQPVAFKNGIIKTKTENEGVIIKGVDSVYNFEFLKDYLVEGQLPKIQGEVSNEILISEPLAKKLEIKTGEKLLVYFLVQREITDSLTGQEFIKFEQRSRNFTICGIYKTSFADFDNNLAFGDIRQIQKLNYWKPHTAGNYEVLLKNPADLEKDSWNFSDELGLQYRLTTVRELYNTIFMWLDKLDVNGIIIIVLMLGVAVINMITALLILILERTNMIGLLKAMGMHNGGIRKIFFFISMKLFGRGLLWGNIVGVSLALIQYHWKIIKLDSSTYYVDSVAVDLCWDNYIWLNVGTVVVCTIFLFIPTLVISKITPVKSIRFE